jgi:hypothetical protein
MEIVDRGPWSVPLRLMFDPVGQYRRQRDLRSDASWRRALEGPAYVAVLLGGLTAVSATGRITLSLISSGILCWSFVPLLQMATAAPLALRSPFSDIAPARALELWFLAHGPWTLWIFGAIGVLATTNASQTWVVITGVAPGCWTAWLITVFFREVLRLPARRAIARMLAHQAMTWAVILTYIELTTATFTRVLGAIAP